MSCPRCGATPDLGQPSCAAEEQDRFCAFLRLHACPADGPVGRHGATRG